MLTLTRRLDETIKLYDENGLEVEVKVLKISRKEVKLGVEAPREIKILRGELERLDANGLPVGLEYQEGV